MMTNSVAIDRFDSRQQLLRIFLGQFGECTQQLTVNPLGFLVSPTIRAEASGRVDLLVTVHTIDERGSVLDPVCLNRLSDRLPDAIVLVLVRQMSIDLLHGRQAPIGPARSVCDFVPFHVHVTTHPRHGNMSKTVVRDAIAIDVGAIGQALEQIQHRARVERPVIAIAMRVSLGREQRRIRIVTRMILIEIDSELLSRLDDRSGERIDALLSLAISVRLERRSRPIQAVDVATQDLECSRDTHARIRQKLDQGFVAWMLGCLSQLRNLVDRQNLVRVDWDRGSRRDVDLFPELKIVELGIGGRPGEEDTHGFAIIIVRRGGDTELTGVDPQRSIHVFDRLECEQWDGRSLGKSSQMADVRRHGRERQSLGDFAMLAEFQNGISISIRNRCAAEILPLAFELSDYAMCIGCRDHGSGDTTDKNFIVSKGSLGRTPSSYDAVLPCDNGSGIDGTPHAAIHVAEVAA